MSSVRQFMLAPPAFLLNRVRVLVACVLLVVIHAMRVMSLLSCTLKGNIPGFTLLGFVFAVQIFLLMLSVLLYRNFRCDCGNSLFSGSKCNLEPVSLFPYQYFCCNSIGLLLLPLSVLLSNTALIYVHFFYRSKK